MYPYPLTGPYVISKEPTRLLRQGARSYPSGDLVSNRPPINGVCYGDGGFGYRDPVTKSDYINPTAYQVWSVVPNTYRNGISTLGYQWYQGLKAYAFASWREHVSPPPWSFLSRLTSGVVFSDTTTFVGARKLSDPYRHPQFASMYSRANNMLLLDLANQTNQIGITLAEAGKTTRYLVNKGTRAVQGLIALKRNTSKQFLRWMKRNWKYVSGSPHVPRDFPERARQHLKRMPWDKRLGSRWLEFNYAIMPLVYDINGVIQLHDPSTARPAVFSVKKRVTENIRILSSAGIGRSLVTGTATVMVQHNCSIQDPYSYYLNRIGATPAQFVLGTAWELIPFSFVADWFLGFNDYLKGLSAYQGITFISGFRSIRIKAYERSYQEHLGKPPVVTAVENETPPQHVVRFEEIPRLRSNPGFSQYCGGSRINIFDRRLLTRPSSYSYKASFEALSARRILTLTSLLAVLRR